MEKIKIRMIEQLNDLVAQAEKVLTAENFPDSSCFDLMNRDTEKFIEITNEFKHAVFPENNIGNNILNLKNTLLQLQQKVTVAENADEPNHGKYAEVESCEVESGDILKEAAATVEIEQTVLDFAAEVPAVAETSAVAEAPAVTEVSAVAETPAVAEAPAVTEVSAVAETPAVAEAPAVTEVSAVAETLAVAEAPAVTEVSAVAETPIAAEIPATSETPVVTEVPAVAETSHLLDRLRSLSEEGKSENISALSAMVDKLRGTPPMPEIHLEHPIDLRTSIGINEKFLFVNELFNGSIREFNEAMSLLNNLDDLESAAAQMHTYREKFGWNEDSIAYITLEEMVNQRFSQFVPA
ncbi:MAG: hypothetical protein LBG17_04880 [Bacteroidales bacterium]|jgi:hypothetical protein|nr:hypothetical protein [Bacteroidales bacterium]